MNPAWKNPIASHRRLRSRYYHLRKKAKYTALILGAAVCLFFTLQYFYSFLTTKAAPLADTNADLDQYVWFDGTTYTASTTEANNATTNDFTLASTSTTGSPAAYFGMNNVFNQLKFDIGTPGVGGEVAWEYATSSDATATSTFGWEPLTVMDNTSNFTQSGTVSFTPPSDWAKNNFVKVIAIAGTYINSALAVKEDGTVWSWGNNYYGQLGNGNTGTDSYIPVQVSNLTSVKAVAIGGGHSLILKKDGTVWACGRNNFGELGNGNTVDSNIPVQVSNLTGVKSIAAGSVHSLAVKEDGTVWSWGNNYYGQLGNGNTGTDSYIPVQVSNLTGVKSIAAGPVHSLALKEDGTVWSWGHNIYGQLGDGTNTDSNVPVQVSNLTGVEGVGAGGGQDHSLAFKEDGTVWAWGNNIYGQLGDGTNTDSNVPVQVSNLTGVVFITGGENDSLAIKSDGTAWAWGWNGEPQLGDGNPGIDSNIPVQVFNLTEVIGITGGQGDSLAIKSDGTVWVWGSNIAGVFGNGTLGGGSGVPVQVSSFNSHYFIRARTTAGYSTVPLGTQVSAREFNLRLKVQREGDSAVITGLTADAFTISGCADTTKYDFTEVGSGVYDLALLPGQTCNYTVAKDGYVTTSPVSTGALTTTLTDRSGTADVLAFGLKVITADQSGDTITPGTITFRSASPTLTSSNTYYFADTSGSGALSITKSSYVASETTNTGLSDITTSSSGQVAITLGNYDTVSDPITSSTNIKGLALAYNLRVKVIRESDSAEITSLASDAFTISDCGDTTINDFFEVGSGVYGLALTVGQTCNYTVAKDGYVTTSAVSTGALTTTLTDRSGTADSLQFAVKVIATREGDSAALSGATVTAGSTNTSCTEDGSTGIYYCPVPLADTGTSVSVTKDGYVTNTSGTYTDRTSDSDSQREVGATVSFGLKVTIKDELGNNLNLTNQYTTIAGGDNHSLTLESDGTVWAWGYNYNGQLGDSTNTNSNVPVQVSNLTGATSIASGYYHSLALKSDGTVWAWGNNGEGQLGDSTNTNSNVPVQVLGLTGGIAIGSANYNSYALKSDGTVWAWGRNNRGQLGNGTTGGTSNVPVQVSNLTGVTALAGNHGRALALKSDGTVWAWGRNEFGQLGNGTADDSNIPVQVSNLTDITAITAGGDHNLAIKSDGTVWAWGYNYYGQLGDSTNTSSNVPVQVSDLIGITAIAAGDYHSLAIKNDGTVWAWGNNGEGQLGDSTNTSSNVPVQVVDPNDPTGYFTDLMAVAGDKNHSLAIKSDGTVWAWGYNCYGQLGDSTNTNSNVPVLTQTKLGLNQLAFNSIGATLRTYDGTTLTTAYWANTSCSNCSLSIQKDGYRAAETVNTGLTDITTNTSAQVALTMGSFGAVSSPITSSQNIRGMELIGRAVATTPPPLSGGSPGAFSGGGPSGAGVPIPVQQTILPDGTIIINPPVITPPAPITETIQNITEAITEAIFPSTPETPPTETSESSPTEQPSPSAQPSELFSLQQVQGKQPLSVPFSSSLFSNIITEAKASFNQTKETVQVAYQEVKRVANTPAGRATTKAAVVIPVAVAVAEGVAATMLPSVATTADLYSVLARILGLLAEGLGIKKRARKWGIVYDSKTKRPIDPAHVKIIDENGKVVSERFTDMEGRFGFLVPPGRYRIEASKTHYSFPSKLNEKRDELYDNLYYGETLDIKSSITDVNIPMDPVGIDWNEEIKKKIMSFDPNKEIRKKRITQTLFLAGFILSPLVYWITPSPFNLAVIFFYFLVLTLKQYGFKPKTFGRIYDKTTGKPIPFAKIKVSFADNPNQIIASSVSDITGRYYILVAAKGSYLINVEGKPLAVEAPEKVINFDLRV